MQINGKSALAWAVAWVVMGVAGAAQAQPVPGDTNGCEAVSGPFAWSCARPFPGMACTQITEAADPHTWGDNYFCAAQDMGIQWSSAGPVPGMRCTQIREDADPHTWADNFLCVPPTSPVVFSWSSAGPVPGLECLRWNEPADPHTWADNFLCWSGNLGGLRRQGFGRPGFPAPPPVVVQPPPGSCESSNGGFAWSCSRPLPGMACTQITEAADPHTWSDNYFCSAQDIGMRWSSAGPIPGMRCTQIREDADPHTWGDNFLCVPPMSTTQFQWSSAGPIAGLACVQWNEPADPHTWGDNFLCWRDQAPVPLPLPPPRPMCRRFDVLCPCLPMPACVSRAACANICRRRRMSPSY